LDEYIKQSPPPKQHINCDDLRKFFVVLQTMGVQPAPRYTLYWNRSKNEIEKIHSNNIIKSAMSMKKFKMILNHFSADVNFVINKFNENMKRIWKPSNLLSVDENIIYFRGKSSIIQYNKFKPHPWGLKNFVMADKHGVINKLVLYQGSNTPIKTDAESIIKYFIDNIELTDLTLSFDNYYSTINLCDQICDMNENGSKNTKFIGTIRSNRPKWIFDQLHDYIKNQNEFIYAKRNSKNVSIKIMYISNFK